MKKITLLLLLIYLFTIDNLQSQTPINSLAELKSHLDTDNGNFVMTPGTYYFNTDNCGAGKLFSDPTLILITGSNSTYDFSGVTFEFDTNIFKSYGSVEVLQFQVVGNDNIMLNLTMEDIGSITPTRTALCISLDGERNRIEGFTATTRGSAPYGYGDMFGKGGGATIALHKHGGCQFRGIDNQLIDCTFYLKSYGHGIFIQGATNALIDGCHVEGELRTTDEVLAESGTGSDADNLDFISEWGFEIQPNGIFSLQEDGIRTYSTGIVYGTNGESTNTGDVTIINSTVKFMRSGVTIGLSGGDQYVENVTALGCESGFWVRDNADVVNCRGDASVGPLYSEDRQRSNVTIDLTILDNIIPKYGNTPSLYLAGYNHDITLKDGTTIFDSDIEILVGGTRLAHRWLAGSGVEPPYYSASGLTFNNETLYPVILGNNASNNTIISCGPVTDNGTGNTISGGTNCSYERACNNTAENLQAECYDDMLSIAARNITGNTNNEREVYGINTGDWISFNDIDLTGMESINAIASGLIDDIEIEVRDGSIDGTLLATIPISSTSSNSSYQEFSANLNQVVNGLTNVYFVFTHATETGWLFNLDKLSFVQDPCSEANYDAYSQINALDYCDMSGVVPIVNNQYLGGINDGDWIRYGSMDFTSVAPPQITFRVATDAVVVNGYIKVMLDDPVNGTMIATTTIPDTGGWEAWQDVSVSLNQDVIGIHDVYLYFGNGDFHLNWFEFHEVVLGPCDDPVVKDASLIEAEAFCSMAGVEIENSNNNVTNIGFIHHGDWVRYSNYDLTDMNSVQVRASSNGSGGNIEVRLGSISGTLIGTIPVAVTGNWNNWAITNTNIISTPGNQDIYLVFTGASGYLFNIDWIAFENTLSINDLAMNKIKFYPNPTTNDITISNAAGTTIEIFNINGVMESKFQILENQKTISIENLSSGVHFLKFKSIHGATVKKLIKL